MSANLLYPVKDMVKGEPSKAIQNVCERCMGYHPSECPSSDCGEK